MMKQEEIEKLNRHFSRAMYEMNKVEKIIREYGLRKARQRYKETPKKEEEESVERRHFKKGDITFNTKTRKWLVVREDVEEGQEIVPTESIEDPQESYKARIENLT